MQEWTVVGVVVVLVGLIGSVSGPLIKLNGNITKLTVAVDNFQRALDKLEGISIHVLRVEDDGSSW